MKLGFQHLVCLGLPALLAACGSDTPSFIEKPEGIITLTVDQAATDEDSFDMDELLDDAGSSADAVAYAGDFEETGEALDAAESGEALDAAENSAKAQKGQGQKSKTGGTIASNQNAADATPTTTNTAADSGASSSPQTGSSGGAPDAGVPDASYDSKAVAKACLPHFRGLSQKIKVVDTAAVSNLKVAPGTVLAFKLTGHDSKLNINLPAGNDIPGVCFFVAGSHAEVKFSTASQMDGLAYIAAGNQSSGAIEFLGGSPVRSHIELKGNQAALNVVGLDADLCQGASLKGNAPRFQCN